MTIKKTFKYQKVHFILQLNIHYLQISCEKTIYILQYNVFTVVSMLQNIFTTVITLILILIIVLMASIPLTVIMQSITENFKFTH